MEEQNVNEVEETMEEQIEILEKNSQMFSYLVGNHAENLHTIDFEKSEEVLERLGGEARIFTTLKEKVSTEVHEDLICSIEETLDDMWEEDLTKIVNDDGTWLFSKFFALKLNRRNVVRIHFNIDCHPDAAAIITIMLSQLGLEYVLVSPCYKIGEEGAVDFGMKFNDQKTPTILVPNYRVNEYVEEFLGYKEPSVDIEPLDETSH